MEVNNNTLCKCAFCWHDLDNIQRKKVVKKFEKDYGDFFAKDLNYGNKYDPPPVKEGKKLSSKRKFDKDSLGFYCNDLLSRLFDIRTMHGIVLHAPFVKKETNTRNLTLYCTGLVAPDGSEFIEQCFYTKKEAELSIKEFNKLFAKAAAVGFQKHVLKKTFKAGELTYWKLYEWTGEKYETSKQWPIFLEKKFALERAEHNMRFNVAFCIHWESWKDAGFNSTKSYDYTKENIFELSKKNLLCFEKTLSGTEDILHTPFGKNVFSPEVDEEFITWCKKEL